MNALHMQLVTNLLSFTDTYLIVTIWGLGTITHITTTTLQRRHEDDIKAYLTQPNTLHLHNLPQKTFAHTQISACT